LQKAETANAALGLVPLLQQQLQVIIILPNRLGCLSLRIDWHDALCCSFGGAAVFQSVPFRGVPLGTLERVWAEAGRSSSRHYGSSGSLAVQIALEKAARSDELSSQVACLERQLRESVPEQCAREREEAAVAVEKAKQQQAIAQARQLRTVARRAAVAQD
jgi:hypothetical protein